LPQSASLGRLLLFLLPNGLARMRVVSCRLVMGIDFDLQTWLQVAWIQIMLKWPEYCTRYRTWGRIDPVGRPHKWSQARLYHVYMILITLSVLSTEVLRLPECKKFLQEVYCRRWISQTYQGTYLAEACRHGNEVELDFGVIHFWRISRWYRVRFRFGGNKKNRFKLEHILTDSEFSALSINFCWSWFRQLWLSHKIVNGCFSPARNIVIFWRVRRWKWMILCYVSQHDIYIHWGLVKTESSSLPPNLGKAKFRRLIAKFCWFGRSVADMLCFTDVDLKSSGPFALPQLPHKHAW
jgi:hypothetical protein